ncbi:MAG: DUF4491 family protein [Chloroflexi bacterium]|nr:MAG: DUF4491 family protein [Chloroflexota bacterium]
MMLQPAGIVLAIVTFATIGIGHVLVRRLQKRFGVWPAAVFFALGALVLIGSFLVLNDLASAVLGITAITFIWDGIEMFRQQKRMMHERI